LIPGSIWSTPTFASKKNINFQTSSVLMRNTLSSMFFLLVLLLQHLIILIRQGVHCADLRQEDQDVLEGAGGVHISAHHHVPGEENAENGDFLQQKNGGFAQENGGFMHIYAIKLQEYPHQVPNQIAGFLGFTKQNGWDFRWEILWISCGRVDLKI
jgi:hypothetical protein